MSTRTCPAGKITIVNVNRTIIGRNHKTGERQPPIRVSRGKYGKPEYTNQFEAWGRVRVVYSPDKPLPCGARVWIEVLQAEDAEIGD